MSVDLRSDGVAEPEVPCAAVGLSNQELMEALAQYAPVGVGGCQTMGVRCSLISVRGHVFLPGIALQTSHNGGLRDALGRDRCSARVREVHPAGLGAAIPLAGGWMRQVGGLQVHEGTRGSQSGQLVQLQRKFSEQIRHFRAAGFSEWT